MNSKLYIQFLLLSAVSIAKVPSLVLAKATKASSPLSSYRSHTHRQSYHHPHPISHPHSHPAAIPVYSTSAVSATAKPLPTPSPTFSCDQGAFLIQNQTLFRLNLTSGQEQLIKSNVVATDGDGVVNAIGYNVKDNYIYGIEQTGNGTSYIIRIAANGDSSVFTELGQTPYFQSGDIDTSGHYWISSGGNEWIEFNLDPSSDKFGQQIDSGNSSSTNPGYIADWVALKGPDDYLYSLADQSSELVRWSKSTHEWTVVTTLVDLPPDLFGGLFAVGGDVMYAIDNETGVIYEINVDTFAVRNVSMAAPSYHNDGARCLDASAIAATF